MTSRLMYRYRIACYCSMTAPYRNPAMYIVGLTGGMGAGKSSVARMLVDEHDVCVVDADKIAHERTSGVTVDRATGLL